jgi:hypothetical protein
MKDMTYTDNGIKEIEIPFTNMLDDRNTGPCSVRALGEYGGAVLDEWTIQLDRCRVCESVSRKQYMLVFKHNSIQLVERNQCRYKLCDRGLEGTNVLQ